ncbi:MAG: asparagine synthetase B, partial [Actinomycetota bacterium]
PGLYDEPFSDSSQIPTYLISQLASSAVKVALSGDGGDEVFGGYSRYPLARKMWSLASWLPAPARRAAAALARSRTATQWDRLYERAEPLLPRSARGKSPGERLHKGAELLTLEHPQQLYRRLVSHWDDPATVVVGGNEPSTVLADLARAPGVTDLIDRMMYLDTLTYLPDDILVKVDRASMGVSLEVRGPLLDHRVLELAWSLPRDLKLRGGSGKWVLRRLLYRYVPQDLVDRPKAGFSVPLDEWLRGPLRDWAETLLSERRLAAEGFLRPEPIRRRWEEHLSGARNWHYHLWDVLMFQAWLEEQHSSRG